jgi:hypothetical protein
VIYDLASGAGRSVWRLSRQTRGKPFRAVDHRGLCRSPMLGKHVTDGVYGKGEPGRVAEAFEIGDFE